MKNNPDSWDCFFILTPCFLSGLLGAVGHTPAHSHRAQIQEGHVNIHEFLATRFAKITPELTSKESGEMQVSLRGDLPVIHTVRGALKQVIWLHLHGGVSTARMQELLRLIEENSFGLSSTSPIELSLLPCSCREHHYLWYLGEQVASIWSHRRLLEVVKQLLDTGYVSRDRLSAFLTACIKDEEGVGQLPNDLHDYERHIQRQRAQLFSLEACLCPEQERNSQRVQDARIKPRGRRPKLAHKGWLPFME